MLSRRLPAILVCVLASVLSGCAENGGGMFASADSRPKSVLVSDFVAASEVTATDNGFNTRLERSGGHYPILERRQRTLARVNDEIIATIVADLRAAGLAAQPGNETNLSFGEDALLVSGRLHPPPHKPASQIGFGPGRGNVLADMTLTRISAARRAKLTDFSTDTQSGRKIPAGNKEAVAARNTTIAETLKVENALPEKLSPDVEAQARALGRAVAEKIVAYAKQHDWLAKPEVAEAPAAGTEERVRLPDARPAEKPAPAKRTSAEARSAKPTAAAKPNPRRVDAPEDEEPPDTGAPPDQR